MTHTAATLLLLAVVAGCQPAGPPIQEIKITVVDPLNEVKSLLTNYANGAPVTSEAASFPELVERVKAANPAKGEIVAAGLQKIAELPSSAKQTATALLKEL